MKLIERIVRILVFCFVVFGNAAAFAQCHAPHYRKGQNFGASLYVSISPRDFTVDKLVCLGRRLRGHPQGRETFGVLFFSSYSAAEYFRPPVENAGQEWREWANRLHAIYSFDKTQDSEKETLDIMPLGYDEQASSGRISITAELPLTRKLDCPLEVERRCLMVVEQPFISLTDASEAKTDGEIVLRGTITASGTVADIQLIDAHVSPNEEKAALVDATTRNLKSWQFDAGSGDDAMEITYSYVTDNTLPAGTGPSVRWNLPRGITILSRTAK